MRCLRTWCTQLLTRLLPAGNQTPVHLMGKGLYVKQLKQNSAELFKMQLCNPRTPGPDIMALFSHCMTLLAPGLKGTLYSQALWIVKCIRGNMCSPHPKHCCIGFYMGRLKMTNYKTCEIHVRIFLCLQHNVFLLYPISTC